VFADERDGDRVTPIDGTRERAPAAVEDFSQVAPVETVSSSDGRGWRGVRALRFRHTSGEVEVPPFTAHALIVHMGPPVDVGESVDGARPREARVVRGEVAIIPAGVPTLWRWGEQAADRLHLYLDPALLEGVAAEAGSGREGFEVLDGLCLRDPLVEQVGLSLLSELETGGPAGTLYAESLANALAAHVIREYSSLGRRAARLDRRPERGLSSRVLRHTVEYVEENLAKDLSLAEIARAANMSPRHFSRLFKEAVGSPPHRYVVERRVERAKELLLGTDLPIAEVARGVGFSNQSHLHFHVKRLLGATPASLRSCGPARP
jgi:AraC family transcriptional regulator